MDRCSRRRRFRISFFSSRAQIEFFGVEHLRTRRRLLFLHTLRFRHIFRLLLLDDVFDIELRGRGAPSEEPHALHGGHGDVGRSATHHERILLLLLFADSFAFLHGHFVAPQSVLVVAREAVHHDGYGQCEDEDAEEGAKPARHLPQHSRRVEVVTHRGEGHEGEPEGVDKVPDALVALGEVDEAGYGQHGHANQEEEEAELFVRLRIKG